MQSPYLILGPALVSFSGGRTSGYMLRKILDAHGGQLPDDVHVVFCNTGKEYEETLRYVHECSSRWSVPITWLEFNPDAEHQTDIVGYNSARRNGEPFDEVIKHRGMLPNPVAAICTQYLKVKRCIAFMQKICGYGGGWSNVLGLRHDEQRRVLKQKARNEAGKEGFEVLMPLNEARVTRYDVAAYWKGLDPNPPGFDLGLDMTPDGRTPTGNCDLCFKKKRSTIQGIMRVEPQRADWWIDWEMNAPAEGKLASPERATFRANRPPYAAC